MLDREPKDPHFTDADGKAGFCSNDHSEKSSWMCNDCGVEFCGSCVTPHKHALSNDPRYTPFATCPRCKGMCIDYDHPIRVAREELRAKKRAIRHTIKVLVAITLASILFAILLYWLPFEFKFLLFFIWAVIMLVLLIFALFTAEVSPKELMQGLIDVYIYKHFDDFVGSDVHDNDLGSSGG